MRTEYDLEWESAASVWLIQKSGLDSEWGRAKWRRVAQFRNAIVAEAVLRGLKAS